MTSFSAPFSFLVLLPFGLARSIRNDVIFIPFLVLLPFGLAVPIDNDVIVGPFSPFSVLLIGCRYRRRRHFFRPDRSRKWRHGRAMRFSRSRTAKLKKKTRWKNVIKRRHRRVVKMQTGPTGNPSSKSFFFAFLQSKWSWWSRLEARKRR